MNDDDINLDDISFSDDVGFDDLDMEATPQAQDRNPTTEVVDNVYSGAISKATDVNYLKRTFKKNLPDNYKVPLESAERGIDQLDKAKRNLVAPITRELPEFKRNINRLSPMVKRVVGERFGNKFDELTKVKAKDAEADPDQVEITSALTGIFSTWRENELEDRQTDTADKMMSDWTEEERFNKKYRQFVNIGNLLEKSNSFNEQVTLKVQEKELELNFKKYHILRNLLKVTTEGYNTSITELKAITKNTGLPEIIKRQNSENFKQLFLDEWQGRGVENIVDFGRGYFNKFAANIQTKAGEVGGQVSDAMSAIGEGASAFAEMDEMQQELGGKPQSAREIAFNTATKGVGSGLVGSVIGKAAGKVNDTLSTNQDALKFGNYLNYLNRNKENLVNDTLDSYSDRDGIIGNIATFFKDLAPSIGKDREVIRHTLADKATMEAQWDRLSRESLVKIIPGWLAKIHLELKKLRTNGEDSQEEVFDIYKEGFTTKEDTTKSLEERLVSEESIKSIREDLNNVVNAFFNGNEELKDKLTQGQIEALEDVIIRSANNDVGTNLDKFSSKDTYITDGMASEEDAEVLSEVMSTLINNGDSGSTKLGYGRFSTKELGRRNNLLTQFDRLKATNPETQDIFNKLYATGNNELLEELGYANRDTDGTLKVNFKRLYDRKLGRDVKDGNPTTPEGGTSTPQPITPPLDLSGMSPESITLGELKNVLETQSSTISESISTVAFNDTKLETLLETNNTIREALDNITNLIEVKLINPETKLVDVNVKSLPSLDESVIPEDDTSGIDVSIEEESIRSIVQGLTTNIDELTRQRTAEDESVGAEGGIVGQLRTANTTLSDMRAVLTEMFTAQQANHSEIMGRNSFREFVGNMGLKVSNILSAPWKILSGGFKTVKDIITKNITRVKDLGKSAFSGAVGLIRGASNEFKSQFSNPDDVYVVGEAKPVLLGKDIRDNTYRSKDKDGKVIRKTIKSVDDIHGEVIDQDGNIVVSAEDFQKGLEVRTKSISRKIGGYAVKGLMLPVNLVKGSFNVVSKVAGFAKDKVSKVANYLVEKGNSLRDIYNSTGELLVSKVDLEKGKLYYLDGDKKVTVTSLKDLSNSPIYRHEDDSVVISAEDIKNGIRNSKGSMVKVRKLGSMIGDKVFDAAKFGLKMVASPFTLAKGAVDKLSSFFRESIIKSLLIHVPDNVLFKANTVHLYAGKVIGGKDDPSVDTDDVIDPKTGEIKPDAFNDKASKNPPHTDETVYTKPTEEASSETTVKAPVEEPKEAGKVSGLFTKAKAFFKSNAPSDTTVEDIKATVNSKTSKFKEYLDSRTETNSTNNVSNIEDSSSKVETKLNSSLDTNSSSVINKFKEYIDSKVETKLNSSLDTIVEETKSTLDNKEMSTSVTDKLTQLKEDVKESVGNKRKEVTESLKDTKIAKLSEVVSSKLESMQESFTKSRETDTTFKQTLIDKLTPEAKVVKGDRDGDGVRDGSWQDQVSEDGDDKDKGSVGLDRLRSKKDDKGSGFFDKLKFLLTPIIAMALKLKDLNFSKLFDGLAGKLSKALATKTITDSIGDIADDIDGKKGKKTPKVKGGKKGILKGLISGASTLWSKTKGFVSSAAKTVKGKLASKVGAKVATKVAGRGVAAGVAGAGLTIGGVAVAPIVGIAAGLWTAYEAGSALFGYFDRRRKTKVLEFLRFMQYGYHVSDDGKMEDTKVTLRYFENEMLGEIASLPNGNFGFNKSSKSYYEEYYGDFDLEHGNLEAEDAWIEWFDFRFKPVFFTWLGMAASKVKETKKSGFLMKETKVTYKIDELDDLPYEEKYDFAKKTMEFNGISPDPLINRASCFSDRPIDTNRSTINGFIEKHLNKKASMVTVDEKVENIKDDKSNRPKTYYDYSKPKTSSYSYTTPPPNNASAGNQGSKPSNVVPISGKNAMVSPLKLSGADTTRPEPAPHNVTDIIEKRIAKYDHLIKAASVKTGVDEYLIRSVIRQESAGKPDAKSYVGAGGLMQLMPATAKELGVTDRFDPGQNIMGGAEYIRRQLKRFNGSPELALAAYNAGGGNVNKARRKAGTDDPEAVLNYLPNVTGKHSKETQQYVVKITNDYRRRTNQGGKSIYHSDANRVSLNFSDGLPTKELIAKNKETVASVVPITQAKAQVVGASTTTPPSSIAKGDTPTTTDSTVPTPTVSSTVPAATETTEPVVKTTPSKVVPNVTSKPVNVTNPTVRKDPSNSVLAMHKAQQVASTSLVDKHQEELVKGNKDLNTVNSEQLNELKRLNETLGLMAEGGIGFSQLSSSEPVAKDTTNQPTKRFNRKVIKDTPVIPMQRKVS